MQVEESLLLHPIFYVTVIDSELKYVRCKEYVIGVHC